MSLTDNFNRSDGSLGSNWTTLGSSYYALAISSNTVVYTEEYADNLMFYSGSSWEDDQSAQATLGANDVGNSLLVFVRGSTAGNGSCICLNVGNSWYQLRYKHGGSNEAVIIQGSTTTDVGDIFKLGVVGTTYTVYRNGSSVNSASDSSLSSGSPGIGIVGNHFVNPYGDDWVGTGEVSSGSTPINAPFGEDMLWE
jgi:hypothetical protein